MSDDIANLLDNIPAIDSYMNIKKKIGHGTFSSVYLGTLKQSDKSGKDQQYYAVKHIIPTSHPSRIFMELKSLKLMNGQANIIKIIKCFRHENHFVFIMPFINHDFFQDYVGVLNTKEVREYLHHLLTALQRIHSFNIIHRDIKPANFLVHRKRKMYVLVDFGLAQEVDNPYIRKSLSNIKLNSKANFQKPLQMNGARVKRKLSDVSPDNSLERPQKHIMTSRGSCSMNHDVRRSPRKNFKLSSYKENLPILLRTLVHDSPSKHTRLAEAMRRSPKYSKKDGELKCQCSQGQEFSVTRVASYDLASCSKRRSSALHEVKLKDGRCILRPSSCKCYGQPRLCKACLERAHERAPRAGTPGFRAPEVLLRHPHQTTAVDLWATGVIVASLLSGRYPFFRSLDDMTSLAEICSVLGSNVMKKSAAKLDKLLTISDIVPSSDLLALCKTLRSNTTTEEKDPEYPASAYHLLSRLLDPNQSTRITASQALLHPFMVDD